MCYLDKFVSLGGFLLKGKSGVVTCYIIAFRRLRNSGDSKDAHDTDSGWRQQIDVWGVAC